MTKAFPLFDDMAELVMMSLPLVLGIQGNW